MNKQLVLREHEAIALPDVAVRVNVLHAEIGGALRLSLQKAIEIGGLLTEAKRQAGHGAFGEWLSVNVAFTDRTARRYMVLHENQERLLKSDSVSDVGSAYRLLSAHSEAEESASIGTAPDFLPKQGRMAVAEVVVKNGSKRGLHSFMLQEDYRNPGFFYGAHIFFGREGDNDSFIDFTMRPLRAFAWGRQPWSPLREWIPDGAPQLEWTESEAEPDHLWREVIEGQLPRDTQHLRRGEFHHA